MRRPIVISMYVDLWKGTSDTYERHASVYYSSPGTHHIGIKDTHPGIIKGRNGEEESDPPKSKLEFARTQ
jgi:hypothetical protein